MLNLLRSVADEVHVVGRAPLPDERPGLGPLSGIATGLERSSTDANIFVAVDLPHLTQEFLKYLRLRLENSHHVMLACKIGSDFPLCLGIRQPVLPEIKRRLATGQWSVRGVIEASAPEIIAEEELCRAGFDPAVFQNINTPEDYKRESGRVR